MSVPTAEQLACPHEGFGSEVRIARLEDTGQFNAELRITCSACGLPFAFLGLEPGLDLQGARVSLDGLEARLAIAPMGTRPNPFQRMAYGVERLT